MRPRVSVVIPNRNGEALLPRCLTSLRRQSFQEFELVLVDNGSTDRSLEVAQRAVPESRFVRFPDNRSFSAAVNAGIAAAQGVDIALLNSDVELGAGWLEALVGARLARAPVRPSATAGRRPPVVRGAGATVSRSTRHPARPPRGAGARRRRRSGCPSRGRAAVAVGAP